MFSNRLIFNHRFWGSFWTQFFGAFNDNVFKNALVVLITFKSFTLGPFDDKSMVALCGGIFILPFFLFSATAGQISDRYPKNRLMFLIKVWEIIVMIVGSVGFIFDNIYILLITLFFMGLQSTFFGPVKYAVLPELVDDSDLVEGNALFEMGTFVAILLGTIVGGLLIGMEKVGETYVSLSVIIFAIIGTLFSMKVPALEAKDKTLSIDIGLIRPTIDILKITHKDRNVFLAVMGISWFWFLGAALLSMFPGYAKDYINGDESVVTLFLAMFSIGVAIGSIICEKLSRHRLELGLVPFGTIGISIFLLDMFIIGNPVRSLEKINAMNVFFSKDYTRILIDLFGLSLFSGFYTVPLYTFVQKESSDGQRSRVIAGLNILNALFMVFSAVILTVLYSMKFSMPQIFGIWALLNLIVSIYIYTVIPEFLLRFLAMLLGHVLYRLKVEGHENIPKDGACILTCNHVSFADWLILSAGIKRPLRFVMYYKFMKIPFIRFLFKDAKVIPIAGKNENEDILNKAMLTIKDALQSGDIICIFPEGEITYDGKLNNFRPGIEKIIVESPVPVIPMVLNGLWGSLFSRKHKDNIFHRLFVLLKLFPRKVRLSITPAWNVESVNAQKLESFTRENLHDV